MVGEVAALYDHYRATVFLSYFLAVVPLVYIIVYTVGKLLCRTRIMHCCTLMSKLSSDEMQNELVITSEEMRSPHNEDYEPLLAVAREQGNVSTDCSASYGSM